MYVALGIIALLVIIFIALYNGLVKQKNQVENALSQIDTQLQRRYDLIPNLVETVKGYAAHEKEVFEQVTAARTATASANTLQEKAEADNMMTGTLKSLFAVSENYPQLKANENFAQLQTELTNTENKIAFSRQFYNDSVNRFNDAIVVFPQNLVAGMLGYKKHEYFEVKDETVRENVKVKF
ncbi:MAG: LemA family protein [Clostridiales bacterium]|jgi:LemA protein|nr:LemA family protein [Clostridiales bacterium]